MRAAAAAAAAAALAPAADGGGTRAAEEAAASPAGAGPGPPTAPALSQPGAAPLAQGDAASAGALRPGSQQQGAAGAELSPAHAAEPVTEVADLGAAVETLLPDLAPPAGQPQVEEGEAPPRREEQEVPAGDSMDEDPPSTGSPREPELQHAPETFGPNAWDLPQGGATPSPAVMQGLSFAQAVCEILTPLGPGVRQGLRVSEDSSAAVVKAAEAWRDVVFCAIRSKSQFGAELDMTEFRAGFVALAELASCALRQRFEAHARVVDEAREKYMSSNLTAGLLLAEFHRRAEDGAIWCQGVMTLQEALIKMSATESATAELAACGTVPRFKRVRDQARSWFRGLHGWPLVWLGLPQQLIDEQVCACRAPLHIS